MKSFYSKITMYTIVPLKECIQIKCIVCLPTKKFTFKEMYPIKAQHTCTLNIKIRRTFIGMYPIKVHHMLT